MNFDEDDVRRALDVRSAPPSAEFRERLSSALAHGPRGRDLMPALAAAAAVVLAVGAVGVLAFVRTNSTPRIAPVVRTSPTPPSVVGVLQVPPHPIVLPAHATISAPTHEVVWALVSDEAQYLYLSNDQGRSWEQRPLPPTTEYAEISFISDREGWLAAEASPSDQCAGQSVQIWHTDDAGATWQLLGANGIAHAECKGGLSFTDHEHGFIGAYDLNGPAVVYNTKDGGLTWKASDLLLHPVAIGNPADLNLTAGRVHSFGSLLLVAAIGFQSHESQYVYESNDSGATWSYQATATPAGGTLAFLSATHWLQLIGPGESQETTDGGKTWHISSSDYSQAAPVAPEVDFADGQVGYATVRGETQLTVDGGQHWTSIKTPGT